MRALRWVVENDGDIRQTAGVISKSVFALLLGAALLAGCKKTEIAAPPPPPSIDDQLPTQAQAKLPTVRIYLGAEQLDAEMAVTPQQERTGMMFRTNILETDAMIFVYPYPQRADYWMKNCPESLSAAYIGPDGVIEEIHHLEKQDTNSVVAANDNIQFVLEVKDGWFTRHNVNTGMVIRTEKGTLRETFLRK